MGNSRDRRRNVCGDLREAAWHELAGEAEMVLEEQVETAWSPRLVWDVEGGPEWSGHRGALRELMSGHGSA